tara:strand:- start:520 stop:1299 length:780 start_codon:yes stop_codon:yes gene_type:complete
MEVCLSLEYAPRGLVGVLVPQANTTVEPEMQILMPRGISTITARLTSLEDTIEARLIDYYEGLENTLGQFANAPIDAIAVGCTGASYLVGRAREAELVKRWSNRAGVPAITTGLAVVEALNAIGARKVGFVSCYPPKLTEASAEYWSSHGFEVGHVVSAFNEQSDFHPIYSLRAQNASEALTHLRGPEHDAIVLLGTGMPTLRPIADVANDAGPLVLSCMLCLALCCVQQIGDQKILARNVRDWSNANEWSSRLKRFGV